MRSPTPSSTASSPRPGRLPPRSPEGEGTASSDESSSPESPNRRRATRPVDTSLRPRAVARASASWPAPSSSATAARRSSEGTDFPRSSAICSRIPRPTSRAWSRSCSRSHFRMSCRALLVATNSSQSRLGVWLESVRISTVSPLSRSWSRGRIWPSTFAPRARSPTSVWMANAKSRAVAPSRSSCTSPRGVKTKISSSKRSTFRNSRNSSGSFVPCCHSRTRRNQVSFSSTSLAPPRPSLYRQCAAMPYSDVSCISRVRIWTSYRRSPGPNTTVWRLR